ncbi:MAG: CpaF family protein [Bdellovibrionales bacterium]|nr:CpaF family protein [Bdellovibrionales bacterium]
MGIRKAPTTANTGTATGFEGPDTDRTDPHLRVQSAKEIAALPSATALRAQTAQAAQTDRTETGIPRPRPAAGPTSPSATGVRSIAPNISVQPIRMPDMGILETFMKDPAITEIMINDTRNVMVETGGKIIFSGIAISDLTELNRLIRNILDFTGRVLSADSPIVDAILPDGSRVNIIVPPLAVSGPAVTIRKFPTHRYTLENLMNSEMMDRKIAYFLNACVVARINILISGGTGSGKTTLMNSLLGLIPKSERIVTIEDTPELALDHPNSVRLQTKAPSLTLPAVTARDLIRNALRMRPDRVLLGEIRGAEAFDLLTAMNSGHPGSYSTIHANTARDALGKLETYCMLAGSELPLSAIRRQIVSAVELVVQVKRFRSGKRRVVQISEITGLEQDAITMQELYEFELGPQMPGAPEKGIFKSPGYAPKFIDKLKEAGIDIPPQLFQ